MILRSRMLILAATLPFVAGCGMYLHRPELEASTAAVKTSFGALSAPAYLERQKTNLEQYAAREDRSVTEFQVASRNYTLLNILRPPARETVDPARPARTPAAHLQGAIEMQLNLTTNASRLDPAIAAAFEADATRRPSMQESLAFYGGQMTGFVANYQQVGGKLRNIRCLDFARGHPEPAADDPDRAKEFFSRIRTICLRTIQEEAQLPDCTLGVTGGRLAQVCSRLHDFAKANADRRAQLRQALTALNRALAAANAPRSDHLTELLDHVSAARDVVVPEDVKEALVALDALLGSELAATLNRAGEARTAAFDMPVTQAMIEVLNALNAGRDVAAARSRAPLDQPTAILIAIAKVRHDLNLVELEIQESQRQFALLEAEAAALRSQGHYLARAQAICGEAAACGLTGAYTEALSHFVSSYDRGLIPYEILRSRELQVARSFALRRAQATEADYRAILQPAIDQLAAYGAGGLKPEVLAPFLASLPVTTAILGR